MGLFEVVGDGGLVVAGERDGRALGPLAEPPVQLGAARLEDATVGGVPDQHVVEAQDRFVAPVGARGLDDVLASQPFDGARQLGAVPRRELEHGAERELRAGDRGQLDEAPFELGHPLDACGQQRLDRGRHLDGVDVDRQLPPLVAPADHAVVEEHADQLADEQRVPLGRLGEPAGELHRKVGSQQLGSQGLRGLAVEPLDEQHVVQASAGFGQRGANVADLRAGEVDDEQWRVRPLGEVLDEVEHPWFGPLDVVDHEHQRAALAEQLAQAPDREEGLLRSRHRCGADEARDETDQAITLLGRWAEQARDGVDDLVVGLLLREPGSRPHELGDRVEGRRPGALATQIERGKVVMAGDELGGEASLAHTGITDHGHQRRSPTIDRNAERVLEPRQLVVTADERRRRLVDLADLHHAVGRDRLGLAAYFDRAHCLVRHDRTGEPPGRAAHVHLPGFALRLQPRRRVQHVTHEIGISVADRDLPAVDPDPETERDAVPFGDPLEDRRDPLLEIEPRAHCSLGVVDGDLRKAVGGHHAVADELGDRAAVGLDHLPSERVVLGEDLADRLRIDPFGERRRTNQITEQHGDVLAHRLGRAHR